MEIRQLAELAEMEVLCLCAPNREIENIFCGDLLSWAMGRAQEGACWCTVMGNLNTIAVASLKEAACVVLCEGAECPPEVAQRAETAGVNLLRCPLPEFETALLAARAAGLVP